MDARKLYKELLGSYIAPMLRRQGFAGSGNIYRIERESTVGAIGFQKSVDSTIDQIKFTANIGIASKHIIAFEGGTYSFAKIEPEECHWISRLGFFHEERDDTWWYVCDKTDVKALACELTSLIGERVLPEMIRFMNEESLLEFWKSGRCMGITEQQRLEYLCILAQHYKQQDVLAQAKADLIAHNANRPYIASTRAFLKLLESRE